MTRSQLIHPVQVPLDTDVAPPPLRPLWRPLLTLDVLFFLAAALTIYLAPCGTWTNNVAGVRMWDSSDPGGDYVISALYFFPPGRTLPFIGHPGLTLQLPIWIIARIGFAIASFTGGTSAGFFSFWARHVRWLFILSGWLVAFFHVLSFHVLEAAARRLLQNARAAFFSVLGYATLFPVLFYSTRISVEPLLVIFTLGTFVNLWKMDEARAAGDAAESWRFSAWAGGLAMLGVFTKLQLAWPLVPFSILYLVILLAGKRREASDSPASDLPIQSAQVKRRPLSVTAPLLAYIAAAGIIGGLASVRMDWHDFLTKWAYYVPGGAKQTHRHGGEVLKGDAPPLPSAGGVVGGVLKAFSGNIVDYIPYVQKPAARSGTVPDRALSPSSLFTIAEAVFLAMALAGLWKTLKQKPQIRSRIGWLMVYALALLPLWAYRGLWHYLFIQLVIGAIFFGSFVEAAIAGKFAGDSRRQFRAGTLAVLAVHLIAISFVCTGTLYDIRSFRTQIQPALAAVERTDPGRTVAYISKSAPVYGQWYGAHGWVDSATEFHTAFQSRFVSLTDPSLLTPAWATEHRVQFVLSGGSRKDPLHLTPIADWTPPIKQTGK